MEIALVVFAAFDETSDRSFSEAGVVVAVRFFSRAGHRLGDRLVAANIDPLLYMDIPPTQKRNYQCSAEHTSHRGTDSHA